MNDDNEKKELEEQDPLDDNQEDNDSDDEESNDESLKELLDAARELTDNIINSGMPDGDDEDKLIKISNKISSNIRKNAIIIGLILFPICSLLFLFCFYQNRYQPTGEVWEQHHICLCL